MPSHHSELACTTCSQAYSCTHTRAHEHKHLHMHTLLTFTNLRIHGTGGLQTPVYTYKSIPASTTNLHADKCKHCHTCKEWVGRMRPPTPTLRNTIKHHSCCKDKGRNGLNCLWYVLNAYVVKCRLMWSMEICTQPLAFCTYLPVRFAPNKMRLNLRGRHQRQFRPLRPFPCSTSTQV